MNGNSPWALVAMNSVVVILIGFALWLTHTPWVLLGLLFLFCTRPKTISTRCPKCSHDFVATTSDSNGDEDEDVV